MEENNKLIAEFMGAYFDDKGMTRLCGRFGLERVNTLNLKYHTSWDWLMPVVQKIEQDCEGVPQEMLYISLYSDINEVYNAVIEFINNYNNQDNEN